MTSSVSQMALAEVVSSTLSASLELVSLVWMELAMFAAAAFVYILCVGGAPVPFMEAAFPSKKKVMDAEDACARVITPKGRKPSQEQQDSRRAQQHAPSTRASAHTLINGAKDDLQRHAAMIKTFTRERNLAGATRLFNEVRSSGTSPMIFNCYLDACVQCGDLDGAKAHFEEMKQLNFVDVVGYNTILKAYLARGCTQAAHELVKEMTARGLQANKVTFNEILNAKVLAKDRRGLWNVVHEMRDVGVRPNSVTCSILLKSLTSQSPQTEVQKVISLIDEVEDTIDEVLLSSVIEACIRIRQLDVLSDVMRRHKHKSEFAKLTAPTYGSMIKAYGQAGNVIRVRELWKEMAERDILPTSITFGCMTEALVSNRLTDEALELLHSQSAVEDRRDCINTIIYSTILKGFASSRRIDKVFCVYDEMRSKSIPCNTITYNTMLDACAKCSTMNRAAGLLEHMRAASIEPDIITYSTIVKGYCLGGDVDIAFQVLEDMKSDDKLVPDEIMYNSLLDGCAKQHRVDDALRLVDEMKTSGVVPSNYTLSILVKLLGHARRLNQAFKVVEDLSQKHGFRPNVQVYTCLVQACLHNRRLERAIGVHDSMLADAGCATDEKFYAVLAKGCLQLGQPHKAIEVVRAAYLLPGHRLAVPARHNAQHVGVEARALDEVLSRLRAGEKDEREAVVSLIADLSELRGVHVSDTHAASSVDGRWAVGYKSQRRGQRGGANRNRN